MVLVKINTRVHYHVKKNRIYKNKICPGPVSFFDGNMVVSAGMAHIIPHAVQPPSLVPSSPLILPIPSHYIRVIYYIVFLLRITYHFNRGSGVAEWARGLTGDRTVNGSSPAVVKTFRFASELWQFRLPRLASVFRMRH